MPLFGPEHAADGDQPPAERLYAGFRLYARSLDDVTPLFFPNSDQWNAKHGK